MNSVVLKPECHNVRASERRNVARDGGRFSAPLRASSIYIYIYIYGAYPGAYLVTCVSENLSIIHIYGAYPGAYSFFKRICLRFAALCELNPLASRGRRYKFERPCRANAVAGKGVVLRWPAHTLRIPRNSNSDVLPALLPRLPSPKCRNHIR